MNDSNSLDIAEQTLKQLEEMQSEIEKLTEQNQNLQKNLDEKEITIAAQQDKISRLQRQEADYRRALRKATTDADESCRKMQQKMTAAEKKLAEIQVTYGQECNFANSKTHIYIWVITILAIYASVITVFTILIRWEI